jgi:hypothetical protein
MANISTEAVEFRVADTGSPQTFNKVAEVTDTPSLNPSKPVRDRTSIGDTVRQYASAGPKDPGQVTFPLRLDPSNTEHQAIFTDYNAGTTKAFQIVDTSQSPEDVLWEFEGFYTSYNGPQGGVESDLTMDVTIQVTSIITEPDS